MKRTDRLFADRRLHRQLHAPVLNVSVHDCTAHSPPRHLSKPPPVGPFVRNGSPQQAFRGLGLSGTAVSMALVYGVIQTGLSEELLFRGLIAGSLSRRLSSPALSSDRG